MADPFSSWGSSASASSGPFSSWGGNYHYGGGAPSTGHSLLSGLPGEHLIHQVESLPLNIVQGLYSTGKAAVVDVKNHPVSLLSGPLAPAVAQEVSFAEGGHGGELTTKVVEPTIHAYEQKYWSRDVLSHIVNDPLGTLLDAAALGTIPLGGEGVAIRAASLAEKVGVSGETLDRLNALADAARARRADVRIAYKPNEGPGQVFTAPRARTLQGRRVYNPIRERVGEAKGGTLPLVGNAARANRFFESERVAKMHLDLQDLRDAERSFQPTARARETGLTRAENVALPIAAEYGPKAAVRDALGAPRQQKIRFYTKELAKTKERLSGETSKGARSVLEAQARAQQRIISLLSGSDKFAKQIDEAIKNPRSNFTTALEDARRLVHGHEQAMIASGHAAPEFLEARRFLPQMLMHDMTWEDAKTIGYEQAPANYRSARQEYEAALKAPAGLVGSEAGVPDQTIEAAWIARLQNAGDELRQARTRPGAKRAIIKEGGFYGGSKTLDEIKAEHDDAFYYPHLGPELKHEYPSAKTGNPRAPGETRRNKGKRFTSGQYAQGSQQWLRARVHWIKYESAQLVRQQALRIGEEYDGHNLLPGHVPFNIGMTPLSRGPREAGALDEHFHNLTDEEHASATQQLMNEMFPAHVPGQKNATWQVPESFAKSVKGNYAEANPFVRKFIDRPIEVWKAVVLKYRPAWLVNNILGQHLLLLLHNAGGLQDYVRALSPENRQKLSDALPGLLLGHGTSTLVEKSRLEDLGFETTLRGRVKGGDIRHGEEGRGVGGIVGQVWYRSVSYPAKAVKGFGDGIARANLEVADNIPRTALTYRYLREYKAALQSAESANHAVTNLVKGKSLEQVAAEMPLQAKLEMTAKVNRFLGDFNTLTGKYGKMLRRVIPFASWFKVILEISKDLTLDHPEKLLLVWNLEQAAKHDPSSVPNFNIPSWFLGSVISPGFQTRKGEANLLSTNALNPFATPVQLADQLTVLLHSGAPSGTQSPIASLGPGAEAINLLQGFDPFYGGSYTGPGDKNSGLVRVALGIGAGLPAVRLANEAGLPLTGKYHQPASYDDRFANVGGHAIPLDAILRYMGLPLRRANRAKLQEYARRGL